MKLLLISQYFYPEQFSNNSIAKAMVKRGHSVTAVSCVPNYPSGQFFEGYTNSKLRRETWHGVDIYRARTVARGSSAARLMLNYITYPFAAFRVIMRLDASSMDVSFTSMPSPLTQSIAAILTKWFFKVPSVYWVQDIWPDSVIHTLGIKNRYIISFLNFACGWMYRQADILLVQSEAFRKKIESFGVEPARIRLLPNTAPSIYRPLAENKVDTKITGLVDPTKFNVMFAGNIGESQDFDNLISAAVILKDHPDIQFIIVGSGRYHEKALAKISAEGLDSKVIFLGRYGEEMMPDFFAVADVMLVTLKDNPVFRLTVPYKIQCYMACGRPIISAVNGEGARIVQASGAGVTVESGNPENLAKSILDMKTLPWQTRVNMGNNARQYYQENYSNDIVYDILENALRDSVSGKYEDRN